MFDSNGEIGDPCGVPFPSSLLRVVRSGPSTSVACFHRCFEPHLDQSQNAAVADPSRYRLHQLRVGDGVEVAAQIRVNHLRETLYGSTPQLALRPLWRSARDDTRIARAPDPPRRLAPRREPLPSARRDREYTGSPAGVFCPAGPPWGCSPFGGAGVRYVCWRSASANSSSHFSSPYSSICSNVTPSTPATPWLARQQKKACWSTSLR